MGEVVVICPKLLSLRPFLQTTPSKYDSVLLTIVPMGDKDSPKPNDLFEYLGLGTLSVRQDDCQRCRYRW